MMDDRVSLVGILGVAAVVLMVLITSEPARRRERDHAVRWWSKRPVSGSAGRR